jgi:beta-lactamase class A
MPPITRRFMVAGASALIAAGAGATGHDAIVAIEQRHGGRLGLFVLSTGTGRTLAHRSDERFLMCSTFKGILAALVLSLVDSGKDGLDRMVPFGKRDLLDHSPVTAAHLSAGALSVADLCSAIVVFSDNGAANLLLSRVGGPPALTAYVRALGDSITRFDRFEPALNHRSGVLDTTTPSAFAGTVQTTLLGTGLSAKSRALLEGWMVACKTGSARLRASFPPDWIAGDKTGTSDGRCNDYALIRWHGHAPMIVAAYYDSPGIALDKQEAVLREVGAAVVAWASQPP